jgi:DNA repair protein RecO (recombination protein O)
MATSDKGGRAAPLQAFVLHSWDWSESSLILDLFTRGQGRVVAAAKGAKKPTSSLRPVLLPFHPLLVGLARPAGADDEVRALRSAEWAGGPALAPLSLMSGFYVNELVMKGLARQDPHPALYDAYADTLLVLADAAADEPSALRAFELTLLRELGVLPELSAVTLTTEPLREDARYALAPESGLAPDPHGIAGRAWIRVQAALDHGSPAALREAVRPVAGALRVPLRSLVHYHLGTAQLRTRRVWLEMQRLAEPAHR